MTRVKRYGIALVAMALLVLASEVGHRYSVPGVESAISSADAIIGRPLTPVSYAGVARRTVRRCAVGAYRC